MAPKLRRLPVLHDALCRFWPSPCGRQRRQNRFRIETLVLLRSPISPHYSRVMANAAVEAAGAEVETFAGSPSRYFAWFIIGLCALLAGYAVLHDLQTEHDTVFVAGLIAAVTWVVLVRPSAHAHVNGVLLRNMLRDAFVPWSRIERCKVLQTLQIVTDEGRFHGLGVVRSTRSVVRKQRQSWASDGGGSQRGMFGLPMLGGASSAAEGSNAPYSVHSQQANSKLSYQDYVEQRIETGAREATDDDLRPVMSWSVAGIGVLGGGLLCLVLLFV
jgi:hypothetical protein